MDASGGHQHLTGGRSVRPAARRLAPTVFGMKDELQPLSVGDLHWDGERLTVGGTVLAPGRYAIGDSGAVLDVPESVEEELVDEDPIEY